MEIEYKLHCKKVLYREVTQTNISNQGSLMRPVGLAAKFFGGLYATITTSARKYMQDLDVGARILK